MLSQLPFKVGPARRDATYSSKRLKLKHVVYHSVVSVDRFKDVSHFASKLAIENAIREFDVPFTIIRPNYFIQNDPNLKNPLTKARIGPTSSRASALPLIRGKTW